MTLVIYCAGGLGKEIITLARSVNCWDRIVFADDVTDAKEHAGAPVYRFEEIARLQDEVEFIIASGEPFERKCLYEKIKAAGYRLATVVSPQARVLPGAQIGEGCIVWNCFLSADVIIKENVFINSKVIIGHDTVVGAHSVLSISCFLGGKTSIGERVYMAPGSLCKDKLTIGDGAIISLGAVLLRNVRPQSIMIGNPAKRIGMNEQNKVFGMFDE